MTKWVCQLCVITKGLKGSDLHKWPDITDVEAKFKHLETEHHIPVQRKGETAEECTARFRREQPEARGPNCKCPVCNMGFEGFHELMGDGR